jgi:two-component system, cell cycle sensor histidine kinase and response regulator CckA
MKLKIQDFIDIEQFQMLQDRLNEIYSFPSSIIDNDGNILTATAWQDICTKFHRQNKECEKECIKSDKYILSHLHEANPTVTYKCPHGLVDNATPIIINGVHYANYFTGQFFLEPPDLDFFRAQAKRYGFNEKEYLKAVKKVPVWSKEQLDSYLFFIKGLIEVISGMGLKNLREIEADKKIKEGEKKFKDVIMTAMDGFWLADMQGNLLDVNHAYCRMSGYSRQELLSMHISDLEVFETAEDIRNHIHRILTNGEDRFESRHRGRDGRTFDVEVCAQYISEEGGRCISFIRDITEHNLHKSEQDMIIQLLSMMNRQNSMHEFMRMVLGMIHQWSGCEAVGVRLKDGNDFPYFETKGFPEEFVKLETRLCAVDREGNFLLDGEGLPVLECMCGNVIMGRFDSKLPFFTEMGSFWTNSTSELLASTTEKDRQARTRNRCNGEGYESVALIPLRFGDQPIGLLQFNDPRKGMFDKKKISLFERMASNLAIGFSQRQTANKLQKSEADLRVLINNPVDSVALLDTDGIILEANRTFAQRLGRDLEELTGKCVYDFLPPELSRERRKRVAEIIQSGNSMRFQDFREGIWFDQTVHPVFDDKNKVLRLAIVAHDITGQKKTEDEKVRSQALIKSIVDSTDGLIWSVDSINHGLIYWNRAFEEYFLKARKLVVAVGMPPEELFPPESEFIKQWHDLYERALAGPYIEEYVVFAGTRTLNLSFNLIKQNQQVTGISVFGQDITARKKAEKELKESEARFRSVLDNSPDLIYRLNVQTGLMEYISPSAEKVTGYSVEEIMARDVKTAISMIHPDDLPEFLTMLARLEKTGEEEIEYRQMNKSGDYIWLSNHLSLIKDNSGRPLYRSGNLTDITERKLVEEKLRQSEDLYRKTFLISPDSILVARLSDGVIISINKGFTELTGYCEEDVINKTALEMKLWVSPEDRKNFIEEIKNKGVIHNYEAHLGKKNGEFYGLTSASIIEINGAPHILNITRDITDRKQSEEKFREIAGRLKLATASAKAGVWDWNLKTNEMIWDDRMLELYGLTRENFPGGVEAWERGLHPDDSYRAMEECRAALLGEKDFGTEFRVLRTDGSELHIKANGLVLRDDDGKPYRMIGLNTDITERKHSEEKLLENETKLKAIFETVGTGILVIDKETQTIIEANQAAIEMTGLSREKIIGQLCHLLVCPAQEGKCPVKDLGQSIDHSERKLICAGGYQKDILKTVYPITLRGKDCYIESFVDISERKRAEEENTRLNAQLQQAQKMEAIGRLAGGVAHDFNNMLGVIIGNVELSLMEKIDSSQSLFHNLQEIQNAAKRSADLTRQLLAFARKQTISPRILNLNDNIEGIVKMLKRLIGEDIHLTWSPEKDLWPIKIDPSQIDQVLANLCVNARDAIKGVGNITIKTGTAAFDEVYCSNNPECMPGEYVLLEVSDDGCGMNKDVIEKIFEPFFTTKELGKGTGLGLATVYGIIKQNNGFVYVHSMPGVGTTFRIYLPRFINASIDIKNRKEQPEETLRGYETVLLVEDEKGVLAVAKRMLGMMGYSVLSADTVKEAIRLSGEHHGPIHLLITDIIMPDMNGRELAEQLELIHPEMECLFMSGYTAEVISQHGILDKEINFIHKPFSVGELAAKVRGILDNK